MRNWWTTKIQYCGICEDEVYGYEETDCLTHGRICSRCEVDCTECGAKLCPKCAIEYDGMPFCHQGCIELYQARSTKVTKRKKY